MCNSSKLYCSYAVGMLASVPTFTTLESGLVDREVKEAAKIAIIRS